MPAGVNDCIKLKCAEGSAIEEPGSRIRVAKSKTVTDQTVSLCMNTRQTQIFRVPGETTSATMLHVDPFQKGHG